MKKLAVAAVAVISLCLLQAVMLVAFAGVLPSPAAVIFGSLFGSLLAAFVIALVITRTRRDPVGTVKYSLFAFTGATILSFVLYLLPTHTEPARHPDATLRLPDGTALAVRTFTEGVSREVPLIAIHGGPGVPWNAAEEAALKRLAANRKVVIYDQIGTGGSTRLDSPSGYTFERAVRDLQAVVEDTGATSVALLGYSWGAQVALSYAVQHPDRISRLAFVSPGDLPWQGASLTARMPQDRLTGSQKTRLYLEALAPRNAFIYAMTSVNPDIAHWFARDPETSHRYAGLYHAAAPGLVCDGHRLPAVPSGLGFYANQVPMSAPAVDSMVTPERLNRLRAIPALTIRGECDYIGPDVAADYADYLGQSGFVQVPEAGHALLEEQPVRVLELLSGFLGGQS